MQYMLDTNTINHLIKKHPVVARRVQDVPITSLCISSVPESELLFGLAKRLHAVVKEFLLRIDVLPWNRETAACYGTVRAGLESRGKILGSLDLLIAAHTLAAGAVLVTSDRAISQVDSLHI